MKSYKTPLRYPGGKSRATQFLLDKVPNNIKYYREPFIGGGSVALEFTKRNPNIPVWVNDKYKKLYHFWCELQENGDSLYKEILKNKMRVESYDDKESAHKELFLKCKSDIDNLTDPFEIAVHFFIINKCSFSGLTESSGFSCTASMNNFSINNIKKLPKYSDIIKNWNITNHSYEELLQDSSPDTFIFCDPPYDIKSGLYGKNGEHHLKFDHAKFSLDVSNVESNVMITYNSSEELKELYEGWNQVEWDLTYTMHSGESYRKDETNRKELLLTNYKKTEGMEEFFV